MKVLTVTDPQVPLSKMHHVGATMLPYHLLINLARTHPEDNFDLLVYDDEVESESRNVINSGGIKIINLGEPKARYQQQVYKELTGLVDNYDIIHIHISTPGFVKYLVSFPREVQKKIIYTMHTWTDSLAVSYYYRDFYEKLARDSEINIVFLTQKQSNALLQSIDQSEFYHPERITYIYNAVPQVVIPDVCKEDYAIAVGRMVESKGIYKIVKSCIESNQKLLLVSPPWRATPKEQEYRDRVLDLIKNAPDGLITFSEGMSHEDLLRKICAASVGILFSTFDVFSLFVLECLSQETPILAYNAGSTSEVCSILKGSGVTSFDNYKQLVNYLSDKNYDKVDPRRIPVDCLYEKFVRNYYEFYNKVSSRTKLNLLNDNEL